MFWLLALGAAVLLACGSSSSPAKARPAALGDAAKRLLTRAELAELEESQRRVTQARQERDRCLSAHAETRQVFERARRRLTTARWLFVCSLIPACVVWAVMFPHALHEEGLRIWIILAGIMATGLFSTWAYAIHVMRQRRDRAEHDAQSSRHRQGEAQQRYDDLLRAADRSRQVADLRVRERQQALVRVMQQRVDEEQRGEEFAAWVEKQQSAAARTIEDEQRRFTAFVKEALYHARRVAPDPKRFIAVHGDALLAKRHRIRGAYVSGQVLGSTADECLKLAERALRELPHEVAYWYPRSKDRTAAKVAHAFRAYSGAFREVMLPLALERRLAAAERPRLPERSHRRKRTELDRLLAAMPEGVAERAQRSASSALEVGALGDFQQRVLDAERAQLQRRGVRHELIERKLEAMRANLEKSASEYAEEKGLISGDLE